jgi:hypothetical protein
MGVRAYGKDGEVDVLSAVLSKIIVQHNHCVLACDACQHTHIHKHVSSVSATDKQKQNQCKSAHVFDNITLLIVSQDMVTHRR